MERRDRLITLLRTRRDAGETLQRGEPGGVRYPTSRQLEMPRAWHEGSYEEVDGALRLLRKTGPNHYRHVSLRYVVCERSPREITKKGDRILGLGANEEVIGQPQILTVSPRGDVVRLIALVERWDSQVIPRIVERGLDFLLAFLPERIWLPREVYEAAAHLPGRTAAVA